MSAKAKRHQPVANPPAKKTNPDGSDAAAKPCLACPRPAGYLVQLLLVALYMSTYDEVSVPASCESEQPRPFTLMQLLKQQVGYKSTRCKCGRRACVMQLLVNLCCLRRRKPTQTAATQQLSQT
jgi:hypothetical protein